MALNDNMSMLIFLVDSIGKRGTYINMSTLIFIYL